MLVTEHNRATLHNQDMISLLRDLRQQVSSTGQTRIDDLLASVGCTHKSSEYLTDQRRLLKMLLMLRPRFNTQ
jgi:hypothetical protein